MGAVPAGPGLPVWTAHCLYAGVMHDMGHGLPSLCSCLQSYSLKSWQIRIRHRGTWLQINGTPMAMASRPAGLAAVVLKEQAAWLSARMRTSLHLRQRSRHVGHAHLLPSRGRLWCACVSMSIQLPQFSLMPN